MNNSSTVTSGIDTLRARGWSIHTEGTIQSSQSDDLYADTPTPIADGVATLTTAAAATTTRTTTASATLPEVILPVEPIAAAAGTKRDVDDVSYDSMNEAKLDIKDDKKEKRRGDVTVTTSSAATTNIAELAKSRLSKWAARLFDPNRPRGLIEPPQTIPLNDEFLQAFGKRVQEDDATRGIAHVLPETTIDDEDHLVGEGSPAASTKVVESKASSSKSDRKVKLLNLKFTTTENTLLQACQRFGEVEEINLLADDGNPALNKGRAYVTFRSSEAAQACIKGLEFLEGRPLRVMLANAETKSSGGGTGSNTAGGGMARYWLADLSTKCYRCGQVGHAEKDCINEPTPKPCPLCAKTTHDLRDCPSKACCFNCGIVGHLSKDCPRPRGSVPRRVVCTLCFQSGHHKLQCRNNNNGSDPNHPMNVALARAQQAAAANALCMVCGKTGHYSCRDNKWFFGLDTLTCYNCGRVGHSGFDCDRPRYDVCNRHEQVAAQEIERASTWGTAEEHIAERLMQKQQQEQERQQQQQQQQDRRRDRGRTDGRRGYNNEQPQTQKYGAYNTAPQPDIRRASSLPPQRLIHANNSNYRGGGGGVSVDDGSRRTPPRDRRESSSSGGLRNDQRLDDLPSHRQKRQQPNHQSPNPSYNKRSRWR